MEMTRETDMTADLATRFPGAMGAERSAADRIPTFLVDPASILPVLAHLKNLIDRPYRMLFDLTAVDERVRAHRDPGFSHDFTVVYHLMSLERNADIRLKVPLAGEYPSLSTVTSLWPSADWYEREIWDMFGIAFDGRPRMERLLMPADWNGHPLRKEHPARATDMEPYTLPPDREDREQEALKFKPEAWGLASRGGDTDSLFLNLGPHHPGTHGVFRVRLQLDGEVIVHAIPDIGYHHRGVEKMGERQSWHTFIPYTDRVDYLGGVMNNLAYVLAVEQLAGIQVPERAKVIRVMLAELSRISSHLVWYGTFAADLGAMSPVFYMFTDRERIMGIFEAIYGARMHPSWFRIGGVAHDLPNGWDKLVRDFLNYLPPRLKEYDTLVMRNPIFKKRTKGIGAYSKEDAIEWGVTGPGLRACGIEWDLRKKRPYSGYDRFEFDIPTAEHGDCYDRGAVRVEEMRQSLRIVRQCLDNMPSGPYKSAHPLATPPDRKRMLHDIETLISHFLNVSWGPVIPPGESYFGIEGTKGMYGYYLISDGNTVSYRTRIRTPSFPHLQMLPLLCRGLMVPDLMAILGSIDYVMGDVDR
jgi:NADH-quinone oxidoreductase subunit C/D